MYKAPDVMIMDTQEMNKRYQDKTIDGKGTTPIE